MIEKQTIEELEERILELEKSESEYKQTKDILKKAFDNTQDAILIHDLKGNILDVNDKMCRMYGLTRQEVFATTIKDISSSRMTMEVLQKKWEMVLNGQKLLFEWEAMRPKDRVVFNVEVSLQKILFYGKEIVFANIRNITVRKEVEKALKKEKEMLSTILENNPQGIVLIDSYGICNYLNPGFSRITGYTMEDFSSDEALFEKFFSDAGNRNRVAKISKNRVCKIQCKNGQLKHIELETIFLSNQTISVVTDVTQRIQVTKALQESEEKLNAIFKANPDPVLVCDVNGYPLYLNPSFTKVFGWCLNEMQDGRIPFVPEDQKKITALKIKELQESANIVRFETRRFAKHGKSLNILLSAAVIKKFNDESNGFVVNLTEITD